MYESLVFILFTIVGCVVLTWYLMNRKVKDIHEQLSDKQVVINELAHYAEKITNENDSFVVKKPVKKQSKVASKSKTKASPKPKEKKESTRVKKQK